MLHRLPPTAQRGSKPRCHWITHGDAEVVASRLTQLIVPWGQVSASDRWMPGGFDAIEEAQLHKATDLLEVATCSSLRNWWLAVDRNAKTPNIDIAATCSIEGRAGLLLVEAKAYHEELTNEAVGKKWDPLNASAGSLANHERIGACIRESSEGLAAATGLAWNLSRDGHYQLSNRFAWAWKVARLGRPVIVVYLGFVGAADMKRNWKGEENHLIRDHGDWEDLMVSHAAGVVPPEAWNREWRVNGQAFVPLIRSAAVAYDRPIEEFVVSGGSES